MEDVGKLALGPQETRTEQDLERLREFTPTAYQTPMGLRTPHKNPRTNQKLVVALVDESDLEEQEWTFDGTWTYLSNGVIIEVTIADGKLTDSKGAMEDNISNVDAFVVKNGKQCELVNSGITHKGTLVSPSKVKWSDGDTWIRKEADSGQGNIIAITGIQNVGAALRAYALALKPLTSESGHSKVLKDFSQGLKAYSESLGFLLDLSPLISQNWDLPPGIS
jgi:hypothetical protein